jgi:endonuclease/exonuclease/phosphatase family metal-dependent hydrolase
VKVVTWNMGNRKGAWDYLLEVIKPDFALLQEAQVIRERPGHVLWQAIGGNSVKYGEEGRYRWGSAVWSSKYELKEVQVTTYRGWIQAAQVAHSKALTLISMHVELDRAGRSIPNLHKMLSDLTPLLEASPQVVLGGDLNADVVFDKRYGTQRHSIAFDRIEDLGLSHCNRLIPPGQRGTFRPDMSVMDDHLFVSRSLANRLMSCRVLRDEEVPSDHFPVGVSLSWG